MCRRRTHRADSDAERARKLIERLHDVPAHRRPRVCSSEPSQRRKPSCLHWFDPSPPSGCHVRALRNGGTSAWGGRARLAGILQSLVPQLISRFRPAPLPDYPPGSKMRGIGHGPGAGWAGLVQPASKWLWLWVLVAQELSARTIRSPPDGGTRPFRGRALECHPHREGLRQPGRGIRPIYGPSRPASAASSLSRRVTSSAGPRP